MPQYFPNPSHQWLQVASEFTKSLVSNFSLLAWYISETAVDKMRTTKSYLRTILSHDGYHGTTYALMKLMPASDASALFAALQLRLSTLIYRNFLKPLRDIDQTANIQQDGSRIQATYWSDVWT